MFSRRDNVSRGRIDDHDALARCCFDINIIHADSGASHDLELFGRCQYLARDLGFAANNQRRVGADNALELIRLEAEMYIYVRFWKLRAQEIDTLLRDAISDKY